jgi:hypothetical protein
MHCRWTIALLLVAAMACRAGAAPPRYSAILATGQRIEGDRLSYWYDNNAMPSLSGQALLDPANPLRSLRDRALPLAELPPAYVEMHGGDRLPGVAIDYRTGGEQPFDPLPPHLVVQSAQAFEPPENRPVPEIRVATEHIRRIVWQRRGTQPYQPGTALFRDGRSLVFRAVRLSSGQAHLLLPDGSDRRIPWSDLAELHFPHGDAWSAWFDELVQLCPSLQTRLYHIETSAGLVATASLARLSPRFEGNSADPDRWVHGIQPAWSLEILWVPCREIVYRRSWLPTEAPLWRLPATRPAGERGMPPPCEINRNWRGGPLASQTLDFGGGIGVHGRSELAFELPKGASAFHSHVCLDRSAGKGGSIVARVFLGEAHGNPLWQSPPIVGSESVADTGSLALSEGKSLRRQLVLQIDPLVHGRPSGADPLEIRDHANWCDPLLELDPVMVQPELDRRLARRTTAWKDWTVRVPDAASTAEARLELAYLGGERRPLPGSFHLAVQTRTKPLVLARSITVGPRDNWLLVAATRAVSRGQEPRLEVRIDGELAAEFAVPHRQDNVDENRPLAVSLAEYQRAVPREIDVELRQLAVADSAPVEYRAIQAAQQLPTLYLVLEESAAGAPLDMATAVAGATLVDDDRYHGARSVRLPAGGEYRLPLPAAVRIRERPAWGEYRLLRFAIRKHGGGRAALALETAQPREQPARYDAGSGQPAYGSAKRVLPNLPDEWIVITRDLFADFGDLDVNALWLGCPDGEAALFDHVYLARGHYDLDRIPPAPKRSDRRP